MNARERFREQLMHTIEGMSDIERSNSPLLHDSWNPSAHYNDGKDGVNPISYVRRGEQLYKCLTGHDSQPTWTPENSPSLWAKVMYKDGIRIIPEVITSETAFNNDESGWWGDDLYKCKMDNCVWTPEQYPQAWEQEASDR